MIDWALVHADFLFSFNQWNSNVCWRLLNLPFGIVNGKKEKKGCFTSLLSANGYVKIRSDIRALAASLLGFVHPHVHKLFERQGLHISVNCEYLTQCLPSLS